MYFSFVDFITNPFVLVFFTSVLGLIIGKVKIGRFELGASGGMFIGLLLGWLIYKNYALPFEGLLNTPEYAVNILRDGIVSKLFFDFTLIIFVASVGLMASKDIGKIIVKYGVKFIVMGFVITFVGALCIYGVSYIYTGESSFVIAGAYTGSLSSSPGLAAAIETVAEFGKDAEAQVGYGYAIGYAPGVLVVILAMQFLPYFFRIDMEREKQLYKQEMGIDNRSSDLNTYKNRFDVLAFLVVCLVGYFLGSINFYLGPIIKYVSLGTTGGIIITGLVLGYFGRLGPLNFKMDPKMLGVTKEISLSLFLSIVGLRYGYSAISSFTSSGAVIAIISFLVGLISILAGFILGRYGFKLNWIILSGAICGGMTSTPGLGAAIDAAKSDDVTSGYGATYPFALLGMIFFTIILHKLV